MIELDDVTKGYMTPAGLHVVLDGITATFQSEQSVGILGRNGAGKSTLLRILGGAELPDRGQVVRKGRVSWPIGFAGGFSGSLTGRENCRFVGRLYDANLDDICNFAQEFADIGDYFHMPVRTYSSGMRARLAFGLSMAIDFDTYLVDEVTAVGDAKFQKKCREAFAERQERSSVIIVSHQMSTIKQYCSRCAVLDHGRLEFYDDLDEATARYEGVVMSVANVGQTAATARDLRKARQRRTVVRLALGVVLPTALALVYYGVIAAPQYESVSTFTVRSADGGGGMGLEFFIASVPGSSAGADAMLAQSFILSRDMLAKLEAENDFATHYRDHGDFLSRLGADADTEARFDYYKRHVHVEHDSTSGVITLSVRAYSAAKAAELNAAMLTAAEQLVNDLNTRSRADRIALAQQELTTVEARLTAARAALVAFQAQHDEINPLESAAAVLAVRNQLEGELASARAELVALRRVLQPNAPEVVALRTRIAALQTQVDNQTARLSNGETGFAATIAEFEPLMVEKEFAQHAYQSALGALEMARIEADRQNRYVVTISRPSVPDAATHPDGVRGVLTVTVICFMLLGVGSLLLASVREHANV